MFFLFSLHVFSQLVMQWVTQNYGHIVSPSKIANYNLQVMILGDLVQKGFQRMILKVKM
jgi:hypothetical protein